MININEFKIWFEFLANKSGKGDYITPAQFNSLVNQALQEWTMSIYGNPSQYQPGRPVPLVAYELTQKQIDDLRHLITNRDFLISNGQVPIPDGSTVTDNTNQIAPAYLHWTALYNYYVLPDNSYTERDIKVLRSNEVGRRVNSVINEPSLKRPVAEIRDTYIQVWPKTVNFVRFEYLRYPLTANWAYTVVGTGRQARTVYDATNSVNIDAPKEVMNLLTVMALSFAGINMRESELIGYAEEMKNKGV